MKQIGCAIAITMSMAAGMAAGACLVMSNPCARKLYRMGKHKVMKMMNM